MDNSVYGILWDMDGVLVDTGDLHYKAWSEALPHHGLYMSRQVFDRTFGMNNTGIIGMLLGRLPEPEFIQDVSEHKETLFRAMVRGQVRPLPGAHLWVERLSRSTEPEYRQAVASSAPPENIDLLMGEAGLRKYFATLVSAVALPGKPDPTVFLEAARRLGTPPDRCIVVEDGIPGVEAARRAGMRCIAVTTTNSRQALQAADLIVDSLEELPADAFQALTL